jgi:2-methylisocitrate lyase-like PEP mutase family enzyme
LVTEALTRAHAYLEAGADCVFPILLREEDTLRTFTAEAPGPVNILAIPSAPSLAELAELGVARVSYGSLLHRDLMEHFSGLLRSLAADLAND